MQSVTPVMTDEELVTTLAARIEEAGRLMEESCGGGLSYGWDWPTFGVLFPEEAGEIRAMRAEGRRRGLDRKGA